ncbi:MAG: 3-ketoacyl-ACP synthase, partial [Acidimicrobiia bacterium]|nr:3-ketoacyl-ACP synthase [Acidimicrobiia bacterium]
MSPFVVNAAGRLVFPSSCLAELDFSVLRTVEQCTDVIQRDFEAKAPTGTDILERAEGGQYASRLGILRDLGQHLFWVTRYALPMYEKRPMRWRDVPRQRADIFLPALVPWEASRRKIDALHSAYQSLPAGIDPAGEEQVFALLFDVFRHKLHHATELSPIKPTVAEMLQRPDQLTYILSGHNPDFPTFSMEEIVNCTAEVGEVEALLRWAMVVHNQYPWDRATARLGSLAEIDDDEFVVTFTPRNREVLEFIQRAARAVPQPDGIISLVDSRPPVRPFPPVQVRKQFSVMPVLEALSAVKGEVTCSNDDLIRNTAFNWSPMTAAEIFEKTGIRERRYSARGLEDLALEAAEAALAHAHREPEEIGAVIFCSCTSTRLIPSVACWLSGQLGMLQTHASFDLVAACAGMAYGLSEAVRLLQEVDRPVLLVCAEKFSDKIGNVRTSRMIFGDGAAALVIAPATDGRPPDIEVLQTYASGPRSQVNSIIWPNPEFDNDITVYGPEVKALAGRYLIQMIEELGREPGLDGGTLLD